MFNNRMILIISLALCASSAHAMDDYQKYTESLRVAYKDHLAGSNEKLIYLFRNAKEKRNYIYGNNINPFTIEKDGIRKKVYLGHEAIKQGDQALLKAFIQHITNIEQRNEEGLTMLELCNKLQSEGKLSPLEFKQFSTIIFKKSPTPPRREILSPGTEKFLDWRSSRPNLAKPQQAPSRDSAQEKKTQYIQESFAAFEEDNSESSSSEDSSVDLENIHIGRPQSRNASKNLHIKK